MPVAPLRRDITRQLDISRDPSTYTTVIDKLHNQISVGFGGDSVLQKKKAGRETFTSIVSTASGRVAKGTNAVTGHTGKHEQVIKPC